MSLDEVYMDFFTLNHDNKCKDNLLCEKQALEWLHKMYESPQGKHAIGDNVCDSACEDVWSHLMFVRNNK